MLMIRRWWTWNKKGECVNKSSKARYRLANYVQLIDLLVEKSELQKRTKKHDL
jgi:hypothetical protein